ncbi:DUF7601 domain-containing protein [Lacrimispora sp.]|uniref:DUF7601 domain-containing protein n=1 Tax=Lacrimispora sp. TaxID=2719234 RepID=UPI0028A862B2|nr:InlB B-repeat-containing protein [Lacrimispora sp.]
MKKQCNLYGSISLLFLILLVIGILPVTGVAQNDSAAVVITFFDMPVTEAIVPAGTKREDIPLPETLAATLEDGTTADIPVTWDEGGLYNEDMAGTYTFTADIGTYLYDQARPVAVVTVTEPSDALSGSIGGRLWLDENADGVMDEDESGVEDYPVSLYMADNPHAAVQTAITGTDGTYYFENIEPGSYMVGIASEMIGETEYLLPVIGISGDNKFEIVEMDEETIMAYSETIVISENTDTAAEPVNAGIRLPGKRIGIAWIWNVSNYSQLKTYINQAGEHDIIAISGDIGFPANESITINKSLTLRSSSGNQISFTQSNARRHFIIDSSSNGKTIELTFENIVIDGKKTGGGFEIKAGKTLELNLTNSVIQYCNAQDGGGFLLNTGSSLTLHGGKISGNIGKRYGGGIYVNSGNLTVQDTEITSNTAPQNGGGIYVNSGNLTVRGTKISGNTASQNGAGIYVDSGNLTVQSAEISDNVALKDGAGIGANNSIVFIQDSKIRNNVALYTPNQDNLKGGGLYGRQSEISVENSEISGNTADHGGGFQINGGTLTINDSKITNNKVRGLGGAIYLNSISDATTLIITGGEISGNESEMLGGGISEESNVTCKSSITIKDCMISRNSSSSYGGAMATSRGIITVINSKISGNTAGYGGGIFTTNGSNFTISGGEISGNAALASAGYFGGGQGGGIHGRFSSIVTIKDGGKLINNVAESAGANSGQGGGVFLYQSQVVIEDGEISGNMAKQSGGGIYSEDNGTIKVEAGSIDGNIALNGGGIYIVPLANLTVTSDSVVFSDNKAGKANDKSEVDMILHAQKIQTTHFTAPFDFAYNNFDVGYKKTAAGVFYTVNFDSRGGSTVYPKIAVPGSTITAPSPDPTRDNYSFAGWYRNTAGTNPWNFATDTVTGDMTLYAKWVTGSSVTVSKAVTGDYADKAKEFTFAVCFMNESGSKLSGGTQFTYIGSIISGSGVSAPAGGTLMLDSNGEATFTLKHGQQITIAGVPVNGKVQIIETAAAGYTTTFRDGNETNTGADTGVRTLAGTAKTFAFTNSRAAVVPTGILTGSSIPLVFLVLPVLLWIGLSAGKIFRRRRRSL